MLGDVEVHPCMERERESNNGAERTRGDSTMREICLREGYRTAREGQVVATGAAAGRWLQEYFGYLYVGERETTGHQERTKETDERARE